MDIDRTEGNRVPNHAIKFCLDNLEKADGFNSGFDWNTEIVPHLTLEEIIGALVLAESIIKEQNDNIRLSNGEDIIKNPSSGIYEEYG